MIKGRWKKFLSALMIGTMVCSLAGCAKGQGEKEQKSSIEVGAGRVELLKKYDMIRTADWKKRGDAHAGRIQREK